MKESQTGTRPASAVKIIRKHGGIIRSSAAIAAGISQRTLYALLDNGILEKISRGTYRLTELPPLANPDLVIIGLRVPRGIICLISALAFHEITTQIPHAVNIALEKGMEAPRISQLPISVHRFSTQAFQSGIEEHIIDGIKVRVYGPEKTLADCFKFRNKIGMDIVLEALKLYKERKHFNVDALVKYGKICRVEKVMEPYLEVMLCP
jgi:predicted transcriptional regulator of viral defense system